LVRRALTRLLYQPGMIDDECEAVGGMRIGRGDRSTRFFISSARADVSPVVHIHIHSYPPFTGRAIAQAVSRQLPTAAARVQAQIRSCGICGAQSGIALIFSGPEQKPLCRI
jgi:hypothetical protein